MQDHPQQQNKNTEDPPLTQEIEKLKKTCEEYLNGWKRAKADYSNLQKENEKRQGEMIEFATAGFITEVLPIIDNFRLAIRQMTRDSKDSDHLKGFLLIEKQFENLLNNAGVNMIETVNKKFDPTLHEAIGSEEKEGYDEGMIITELQPGYTMHGKVIQPARVKVAAKK